jgi:signal transduction histidine kinase
MAVFRILQEMLSNVGRHAQARQVVIRITAGRTGAGAGAGERRLEMTVRDDGVGALAQAFDSPRAYGVMGMRERARPFGGQLRIESVPGQGSSFQLSLPLADE